MKSVLFGIDQSIKRATAQAETILDLFDVDEFEAYLLHDFGENPEGASVVQVEAVKRARDILETEGISVHFREGSGDPVEAIIETAEDVDADAICVAGRKRSPAGKMIFGSVSQSVILNTERPVLLCSATDTE